MFRKIINLNTLLIIIPFGFAFFMAAPQIERTIVSYNERTASFHEKEDLLQTLNLKEGLTKKETIQQKTLESTVKLLKISNTKELFNYYKIGGMLVLMVLCFSYMFYGSYRLKKKKRAKENKVITFDFEDPTGDVIGEKISWQPLVSGGKNFTSHYLKEGSHGIIKIKKAAMFKGFAWCFLLIGLNYLVLSFLEHYLINGNDFGFMNTGALFFKSGGPFFLVGLVLSFAFGPSGHIDSRNRMFHLNAEKIPFQNIYALQLISEFVSSKGSGSYYSYEINLITKEGKRFNIMDHGDKDYILSDTVKLSKIFNVPVWNNGVS